MIAGIVLFASASRRRSTMPAKRLTRCPQWVSAAAPPSTCSGTSHSFSERPAESFAGGRSVGAVVLLALIPVVVVVPALVALTLVSAVCALVVAYEVIRYRTARVQVRHAELA